MSNTVNLPADLLAEIEAFDASLMWRPVVDGFIDLTEAEVKQFKMLGVKVARHVGADMTDDQVKEIMQGHLKGCFAGFLRDTEPDQFFRAETALQDRLMEMAAELVEHMTQFTPEMIAAGQAAIEAFDAAVRDGDFDAQRIAIQDFRSAATGDRERYSYDMGKALHRHLRARDGEVPLFGSISSG